MGLLSLTYRRPEHVNKPSPRLGQSSFENEKSDISLRSGRSTASAGIPAALSFDKIMNGGTCPPCTVRDFMNYLIYVERSAENLQFFLWYQDYVRRFQNADTVDISLAPEWTQAMEDEAGAQIQKEAIDKMRQERAAAEIFKGTDFEKRGAVASPVTEERDPFSTPPRTPETAESTYTASNVMTYRSQARDAFAAAGVKAPFTIQPFRAEINRVIATYIMDKAPRQLNLSAREQKEVLHALAYTTHPSALRQMARSSESSLRQQAHPNFIRWSICNGNPARVLFARALGVGLIAVSAVAAVVITLSTAPRGYRAIPAGGFVLGVSTLVAAYKGMCVVLHGMHHRHVRPWELFVDDDDDGGDGDAAESGSSSARGSTSTLKKSSDWFGSSNSYEDEPWVVRYQRRNIVRKIFDREVWILEPALRQIQDTIFVQAILAALLIAGILTVIFVVLVPGGNFF